MYDVAIIGTGPAGVSAALTLKSLKKNFIWFGSKDLSSKINSAELIRNYPGLINISGKEMKEVFLNQLDVMDISIEDKTVTGVYCLGSHYSILCNQDMYEARTIILATGVEAVKPLKGELDLVGMGVSYCATCDGLLYKDKTIACLCTNKEFEHEIEFLARIAKHVYVIALYKDVDIKANNIELIKKRPQEIKRENNKLSLIFKDDSMDIDGIFMLKSAVSPNVLVPGLEASEGHIVVNRLCETNLKGCYAAGDCTGRPYQYTKAVGEGNIAAHSVVNYLSVK